VLLFFTFLSFICLLCKCFTKKIARRTRRKESDVIHGAVSEREEEEEGRDEENKELSHERAFEKRDMFR